ncbi:relaxase/mobilization nuclease domain-containing protein [Campylobacter sp. RM12651]|uniref:relaxase/mobilization nuclease domain-containing protein n=1 Tax=Campylobacter sp. RM12651 TaxID=1660079 RepID=UPI001EFACFE7|nr:relaxase/mobilization nuclease domain-containing protein [Campylobacter sp. RM12651]ULO04601.1 relaxase/mobilization nuclease domain-containing protein [Campylobacter sp. RM12651]
MIVKFKCVGKKTALGWADYVLKDKNNHSLDRASHEIIYNDIELSKEIIKHLNYKTCATNIVISFEKNVSLETARKAAQDYIYEFLDGFNNAYFINMVEHKDTDNIHYHIQIPKINLQTMTQLEVYNHTRDRAFNTALCKYIAQKYDLVDAFDLEVSNNYHTKKFMQTIGLDKLYGKNLKGKKNREAFKYTIDAYIRNLIFANKINSLDDIKKAIENYGDNSWKISRFGEDYKKGSYITIINEQGEKHSIYDNKNGYYSKNDTQNKINNFRANKGVKNNTQNKDLEKLEKIYLELKEARNKTLAKRYKVKEKSIEDLIKSMPKPKLELDDILEDNIEAYFGEDFDSKTIDEKIEIIENRVLEEYKKKLLDSSLNQNTINNKTKPEKTLNIFKPKQKEQEIINEKIRKMNSYKITLEMLIQKEKARKEEEQMIKELQEELKRINFLLAQKLKENNDLNQKHKELLEAYNEQNEHLKDMSATVQALDEGYSNLQYKNNDLNQKHKELLEAYNEQNEHLKDMSATVQALDEGYSNLQYKNNDLNQKHKELLEAYNEQNEHLKDMSATVQQLQDENDDLKYENDELNQKHKELLEKYNEQRKEYLAQNEAFWNLYRHSKDMSATVQQLQDENDDLKYENDELKKAKKLKTAKEEPNYYLRL